MSSIKIQPGILVSLSVRVRDRGLSYKRKLLESDAKVEKTEVTRTMEDPEEHKRAVKVRGAMRSAIEAVCISTPFGPICLRANVDKLDGAIAQARRMAKDHARGYIAPDGSTVPPAKYTSIALYLMRGEVASTDEESAKAIADELQTLLTTVDEGVRELDVEKIREAASKAKEIATMLEPDLEEQVSEAVKAARTAARQIVARVKVKGEDAANVLASLDLAAIATARASFIDTSDSLEVEGEAMPAVSVQRFSSFETDEEPETSLPSAVDREIARVTAEDEDPNAGYRDPAAEAIERDAAGF